MLQISRFFLFLLSFGLVQAQTCDCFIQGFINDADSKKPIAGAVVYIKELNKATQTDAQGKYELYGLCQGKYTLITRLIGYQERTEVLMLKHGIQHDFMVSESEQHLENLNITAQKLETPTLSIETLSATALAQTQGSTLAAALSSLMGVNVLQTGSSIAKPIIHGLHGNRVLILNNGVRQEGQQWGSEHAPEIDPFVAKRLSVVKGAASVRYGSDAIGGVILVEPETLKDNQDLQGEVNVAGFSNGRQGTLSAQMEQAKNGLAWRIQGTWKRGGSTRTPTYFLNNTAVAESNGSATLQYRNKSWRSELFYSLFDTEIGIYSGSHIGSLSDLKQVLATGQPDSASRQAVFSYTINRPLQDIRHQLLKSKTILYTNHGNLHLQLAYQNNFRAEYDLHRPRCEGCPELELKVKTLNGELLWEHRPIKQRITGQIGVSGILQQNTRKYRPLIPAYNAISGGIFLIERFRTKKTDWELGLRYDRKQTKTYGRPKAEDELSISTFDFDNVSFNLGAEHHFREDWHIRFNTGSAWRSPNVSELMSNGVHHGAASYEEGNPDLQLEKAFNSNLNLSYESKNWHFESDFFVNYIRNYIFLKPLAEPVLTVRGAFPTFRYEQTDAIFRGIDVLGRYALGAQWSWECKTSLLWAWDTHNRVFLLGIPPQKTQNQWQWASQNKKNVWSVSHTFVAKQNRFPENQDYALPPPAYQLWGMAFYHDFLLQGKNTHHVKAHLSVQNLFNTQYRDYLNRFRYFADEQGRNIALRLQLNV